MLPQCTVSLVTNLGGRMATPEFDLTGRVAVVTGVGAQNGIGFATASLLARMGASLVVSASSARVTDRATELPAEAKAVAVVGLVRSVALDSAPHGVTVNAVAPGWIATDSQTSSEK